MPTWNRARSAQQVRPARASEKFTRRLPWAVHGLVTLALAGGFLMAIPSSATAASCTSNSLTIVAHEDDDLLFMNPDIQRDLGAGGCATTVFVTAGDDGNGTSYWEERELGPEAAYSTMLGQTAGQAWATSQRTYAGHSVHTATSPVDGRVTLLYLRLPDGGINGQGMASTGSVSLARLANGTTSTLSSLDFAESYTRSGLVQTLAAIVGSAAWSKVRIQDPRSGQADHSDHTESARFAVEALDGYLGSVSAYRGYNTTQEVANVAGSDLATKTSTLQSYATHDLLLCNGDPECPNGTAAEWTARQYLAPSPMPGAPVPGPAPYGGPNLARNASVVASSQASGQPATKAIDGVIGGYPGNAAAEWSANGQATGAWIKLSWASAQTVDRVYLYDRPNGSDQVTGGTLTFSDGTSVPVPPLNNNGSATVVTFSSRATTSLRLSVTSTSFSTSNVGLAELETYNGEPSTGAAAGPTPYAGPNVARNASVVASSQASGQPATSAIDSLIGGYPGNAAAEWSSDGQTTGAWIKLTWTTAQTIDRVYLYDRPNGSDQITGGTLTFSDGSTVTVPALNNNGSATVVTFPARATTSVRLTVTSTSAATANVGLAELETYNGSPS